MNVKAVLWAPQPAIKQELLYAHYHASLLTTVGSFQTYLRLKSLKKLLEQNRK